MRGIFERLQAALADRYAVESEIGRGGMATVFLAEDIKHRRKVAIKVLHPELAAAVGRDRFLREIEAVAGLTHPHVLPLYDSGEADGLLFYSMPYVEGESLRQRLNREKQLPVDEAVSIAREVAEALDHAHRHGLIHRDVKPGNILLEEDHAVVADFGVARAIGGTGPDMVTATGLAIGTPAYMSPEQGAGTEADERSDVYALGCVLYEMLSGEPPLVGPTPQATQARRMAETVSSLSILRDTVPSGLDAIVRRAVARLPADRYASGGELAAALKQDAFRSIDAMPPDHSKRKRWRPALLTVAILLAVLATWKVVSRRGLSGPAEVEERASVAVLPLANRSAREEDAFFTEGFHDELLTRLAMIADLKVISRTSVMEYRDQTKNLRTIGEELGARYIVEGGVQRAGDQVRINLQLIDAREDAHLWADAYDLELSVENLLSTQSEIASRVASAVRAEVKPTELAAMTRPPTHDLEAYELYLRGRQFHSRSYDREDYEAAEDLFRRAIDRDSVFALAWAFLGSTVARSYFFHYDRSEARAALAQMAANRALELSPDLPQAHYALAEYYYHILIDLDRALEEYTIALREAPNDDEIVAGIGFVKRRQGDWWGARDYLAEALEHNPRSGTLMLDLAETYAGLREYAEAGRGMNRAISLYPDSRTAYGHLSRLYLNWTGDAGKSRSVLMTAPLEVRRSPDAWITMARLNVELVSRDYEAALVLLEAVPEIIEEQFFFCPRTLLEAEVNEFSGDTGSARVHYDSARVVLERRLEEDPEDHRAWSSLGIALAGLGRHAEAITAARRSLEIMPDEREAWKALYGHEALARAYAMTGDYDSALDELEIVVSRPGFLVTPPLRFDPFWDQIRTNPRFKEIVRATESPLPKTSRSQT